ncbi:MAG: DEAD/DEAH box helicase [Spirochaetes bacterium]|uniref:DEAD/DEAH box helicase n=1 Tax=Candidatus Ornithospirochaeta stercoripullorum TaxID=2840899 RepID=A0A9D9H610_9SPIO|nr:DEAD/DEAH box helicase [Candidatus Ornithospirochaeta stercoripullorum]
MMNQSMKNGIKAVLTRDGRVYLANNGVETTHDYRMASGKERILIREYENLNRADDFYWNGKSTEQSAVLSRFLRHAASMGMLETEDGDSITIRDGLYQLEVKAISDNDTVSMTLSIPGIEGNISSIIDSIALIGNELVEIITDGDSTETLNTLLQERIKRENLPLFLSILLSRFDSLSISYDNYQSIQRKPVMAQPALIFQAIDEYGYLHVLPDSYVEGFQAGVIAEKDIIRAVKVIDEEKTVEIRDIIFTSDPIALFKKMLGRGMKNSVYEENGYFIIDGPFAEDFLTKHFSELLASFTLYHADVLSAYRIRYQRPRVHFSFSSGIDYLEGNGNVEIGGETMALDEFLSSYNKNDGFVLLNDKSKAYIEDSFMRKLKRIVKIKGGHAIISPYDLPYLDSEENFAATGEALESIRTFYKGFNAIKEIPCDTAIKQSELRDYQKDGYRWLKYLHDTSNSGCLADEMGLGKTVQIIALLNKVSAKRKDKPSLLIAPKSLIHNWLSEIEKFGIGIKPYVYYGQTRNSENLNTLSEGLIISSYATIRNDIDKIADKQFDYVILDESQMVKHFNTRTAQAILNLQSEHRLAVSGTPIENDLGELYSLFRFLNPAIFPTLAVFERDYVKPIMNDADKDAEKELKMKISPFILRRMKKDVLRDLPEKTEQTVYVDMAEEHWNFYEKRRADLKEKIDANDDWESSFMVLQALTELRQIAALPEGKMETEVQSAKRDYLREVLPEITANGHKALIFTSFLDTIEKLSEDLTQMGIGYVTMTGATTDRKEIVNSFQTNPSIKVFLMTLKTGGVGLNLTAADYVFIYDPWWNAAAEEQAINRTHRIGQHNPVFCYRLIAKGTIEEKILKLQEMKTELSSSLISSDGNALKMLSEDELTSILDGLDRN